MPPVLKLITRIVPATYYIDILNGLYLRNLDLFHLWSSYLHFVQHPKNLERLLMRREINMASVRIAYTIIVLEAFNSRLIRELYSRKIDYGEIDGRIRTWYNPNLVSQYFYVPGIVASLVIIRGIFLKGTGFEILWPQFAALLILGLLVFTEAFSHFRKRLD